MGDMYSYNSTIASAATGSTIPERVPLPKARPRLMPSERKGSAMIAPSGIFCIAIPKARAAADVSVMPASPASAPATTAPTAMPSGMLCSVTASISFCLRPSFDFGPSAVSDDRCWCGTKVSSISKNKMPMIKPTDAGSQLSLSKCAESSIEGIMSDHTEAATITPAAKPRSVVCRRCEGLRRAKSTVEAPTIVPTRGIRSIVVMFIELLYAKTDPCFRVCSLYCRFIY